MGSVATGLAVGPCVGQLHRVTPGVLRPLYTSGVRDRNTDMRILTEVKEELAGKPSLVRRPPISS